MLLRRSLLISITMLTVLLAALPARAHAADICDVIGCYAPQMWRLSQVTPAYRGYAYADAGTQETSFFGSELGYPYVAAWRWSGGTWQRASRVSGSRMWAQPFGTGWYWTWTQGDGWLAMRANDLQCRMMQNSSGGFTNIS